MSGVNRVRVEKIKTALERFSKLPLKGIARYLCDTDGELWDHNLENIRKAVCYYAGKHGEYHRAECADKSLFRDRVVSVPKTWRETRTPYILNPGLWLALFDAHFPFHEPVPIEAAIKTGQTEGVTGLLLGGDWWDAKAVSYWPSRKRDFNGEVVIVIDSLDLLRHEFPDQEIIYQPGNHEYRLPRYFMSKAPELAESPLAAMETIMDFESREINFLDYFQLVKAGELPIMHGHEVRRIRYTVNPAKGLFNKTHSWAMCGHAHRTSQHTATSIQDIMLSTWSVGCLCDLHPEMEPYGNEWNWGFALVNVEKNGFFEVINRRVLPNGKVV